MKTNNNDIQSLVDSLTQQEEERSKLLKKQLEELAPSSGGVSTGVNAVVFKDTVKYLIDKSRYERQISSHVSFDELQKQVTNSKSVFGYESKDMLQMWIRNDRDIMCCFREHFATTDNSITFVNMKQFELSSVSKLNFEGECVDTTENAVHFKLITDGKENAVIFSTVLRNTSFADGFNAIKKVKATTQKLSFVDSDKDTLNITNDVEWEYFLNECTAQFKAGRFVLLFAE